MKIERDADDVCLAFLLERALAEADGDEPPSFEGEVVGLIEKGAFVALRRGAASRASCRRGGCAAGGR